MPETQESIYQWAEATFGPLSSNLRCVTRANEEFAEMLSAMEAGDHKKAREEAADVVIVLCRLAVRLGTKIDWSQKPSGRYGCEPDVTAEAFLTMSELYRAVALDRGNTRIGPVLQTLIGKLVDFADGRLGEYVDKKMAINRARKWNLRGDGTGYHQKGNPS